MGCYKYLLFLFCLLWGVVGNAAEAVMPPAANFSDSLVKKNFGSIAVAPEQDNILISPAAAGAGLLWLANQQQGETSKEILWMLGARDGRPDFDFSELLHNKGVYFSSSLWIDQSYKEKIKAEGLAEINLPVSFIPFSGNPVAGAEELNKWLAASSKGVIPGILKPLRYEIMGKSFLLNSFAAVIDFSDGNGIEMDFATGGESVKTSGMHLRRSMDYHKGDGFSAVRMDVMHESARLTFVLPDDEHVLKDIVPELFSRDKWFKGWPQLVDLRIPVLDMRSELLMNRQLQKMGAEELFSQPLKVQKGETQTLRLGEFIQVCRLSLKLAAKREHSGENKSVSAVDFVCDRPFILLLEDKQSSALVLAGMVRLVIPVGKSGSAEKIVKADKSGKANAQGYGPWIFGMSRAEVQMAYAAGPFRYQNEGQLMCLHAPWNKFYDKRCEFYFDGNDRLIEMRLWLYEDKDKGKAREFVEQAQKYYEDNTGSKYPDMVETVFADMEKLDEKVPQVVVYHVPLKTGRSYLTLMRHPNFGWFVYLTFKAQ